MPTPPKKMPTSKPLTSGSSAKPAAKPKKALSFDDPNYGKPAAFDADYAKKTAGRAKQTSAYEQSALQRANAKADAARKAEAAARTKTVKDANSTKLGGRRNKIDKMIKDF